MICAIIKENITFQKYPALHELETRHGVDLGPAYKTKDSVKNFTHYIAEAQRHNFMEALSSAYFCCFLMDQLLLVGLRMNWL